MMCVQIQLFLTELNDKDDCALRLKDHIETVDKQRDGMSMLCANFIVLHIDHMLQLHWTSGAGPPFAARMPMLV